MSGFQFIAGMGAGREAVTDEQVIDFIGPCHDPEAERWRVLARYRFQEFPEEQILEAVSEPVAGAGVGLLPTARISEVPVPAPLLEYLNRRTTRQQRYRGEIGTLPLAIRFLRVSVWLAAGVLMVLGMVRN